MMNATKAIKAVTEACRAEADAGAGFKAVECTNDCRAALEGCVSRLALSSPCAPSWLAR